MATFFVDSNATGANDGTSFADAFTTIGPVLVGGASEPASGDDVRIASDHSEALSAVARLGDEVDGVERVRYISVNSGTGVFEAGATITSTEDVEIENAQIRGLTITTTANIEVIDNGGSRLEKCTLSGDQVTYVGYAMLEDCIVTSTANFAAIRAIAESFEMRGGSWTAANINANQNIVQFSGDRAGFVDLVGVDLSGIPAGRFVDANTNHRGRRLRAIGCQLHPNTTILGNPTGGGNGLEAEIIGCRSDTTTSALSNYQYLTRIGTCIFDSERSRTGGATDGETAHSLRLTALAGQTRKSLVAAKSGIFGITRWLQPGDTNIRIHIAHNGVGSGTAGVLQSNECYATYEGPSELATANFLMTRKTSMTEFGVTPTDLTTDAVSAWSGTEVGTLQIIDIPIAPTEAGIGLILVHFAPEDDASDQSINFCPELEVT